MKTIQLLCAAAGIAATLTSAVLAADAPAGSQGSRGARGPGGRRQGPPPELIAKYDTNQDGQLDETERAALRADVESGKIARPEGQRPGAGAGQGERKGRGRSK